MVAYLTKSDASEGFNQVIDFLNGSYLKYALTVNPNIYVSCIKQFWNTVAIKQVNDVTRLQALVDKKKVVVTEAAIRELLIRQQAGDLSTHTTKYTSPALTQKVFTNMRKVGKGFSGVETPLFKGMLVGQDIEEEGDKDEHVDDVTAGNDAQGDDTAAHGEVPTVQPQPQPQPQQAADFPMSLLQEALDAYATLTRRVDHFEYNKVAQALEITKLKRRVKKLEKRNKVRVLKLKRLQRVGTSQSIDTSNDTVIDDESNQGMIIDEMDKDDAVVLMDEKKEDRKVEEAKVDESAQVQGRQVESQAKIYRIDMDHASKVLIPAAIITAALAKVAAAPSRRRKGVIEMDEEYARKLHAELNKDIDWDVAIYHVKLKAKEDPAVKRYQAMKRKPKTEAQARKNMKMYLKNVAGFKSMEEEESRALQTINETLAEKAAKRRKLNEEVEELKRHLEIMPDEDDDVYTEATPLARKALWNLVKERFSTANPNNFSDDFLLTTLGAMFEKPDALAQVWNNQKTIHGQAKVKSWKLLESYGVHIIIFKTTQLILLVERSFGVDAAMDLKKNTLSV
nr:hypothetical protein [Tanacetum cinerariifolium]